jgi:hypothetical protein
MGSVPVVMVIAILVVLVAVVLVALGRGGQLSRERGDYAPLELGPVSATDVVLLRPPTGLWGYDQNATDAAMEQIAEAIRERDIRIVALEQLVTDLSQEHVPASPLSSPYLGARHRRLAGDASAPEAPQRQPLTGPQPSLTEAQDTPKVKDYTQAEERLPPPGERPHD